MTFNNAQNPYTINIMLINGQCKTILKPKKTNDRINVINNKQQTTTTEL